MKKKILKSHRNDFPEYYGEYEIKVLKVEDPLYEGPDIELRTFRVESLETDIQANGLTHPVILWSDNHRVQIGTQRVYVAKRLGYTHISAYKVHSDIELNRCNDVTLSDDYYQ